MPLTLADVIVAGGATPEWLVESVKSVSAAATSTSTTRRHVTQRQANV